MSDPVRFYFDEHIPSAVAEGLRHRGVKVLTVSEAEMLGARDEEHLEFARKEDCVVVSHEPEAVQQFLQYATWLADNQVNAAV